MTGRLAPYFPVFTICLALSQCKVPLHGWWLQIEVNQHPSHAPSSSFKVLLGGQFFLIMELYIKRVHLQLVFQKFAFRLSISVSKSHIIGQYLLSYLKSIIDPSLRIFMLVAHFSTNV